MAKKSKSLKSNAFDNDESVREQIKEVIEEALYPKSVIRDSVNTIF